MSKCRHAQEQGRITSVLYDPSKPVSVYFDLGWSDQTAVWFAQHIAGEIRLIDFLQDAQRPFSYYLRDLQGRGYIYATIWLPHDAQAKSLGTGRSIEEMARNAGWRVRIVPRLSVADGINAVRTSSLGSGSIKTVVPMVMFSCTPAGESGSSTLPRTGTDPGDLSRARLRYHVAEDKQDHDERERAGQDIAHHALF